MLPPRRALPAPIPIVMLVLACQSALPVTPQDAGTDAGTDGATTPPTVGPIDLPEDHGGSRLKLGSWGAPGGASVPGEITDSQLGVRCFWTLLEGGFRCLPDRQQPTHYADPGCTQPLMV